jgi:hypothetical protein
VLNVRTVRAAAMINLAGNVVSQGPASFRAALDDFADNPAVTTLFLGILSLHMAGVEGGSFRH